MEAAAAGRACRRASSGQGFLDREHADEAVELALDDGEVAVARVREDELPRGLDPVLEVDGDELGARG